MFKFLFVHEIEVETESKSNSENESTNDKFHDECILRQQIMNKTVIAATDASLKDGLMTGY